MVLRDLPRVVGSDGCFLLLAFPKAPRFYMVDNEKQICGDVIVNSNGNGGQNIKHQRHLHCFYSPVAYKHSHTPPF